MVSNCEDYIKIKLLNNGYVAEKPLEYDNVFKA